MKKQMALTLILLLLLAIAMTGCGSKGTPAPTATIEPPTATPSAAASPGPMMPVGGVDVAWKLVVKPEQPVVARVNGVEISTEAYLKQLQQQLYYVTDLYKVDWNDEQTQAALPEFQDQILQQMVQFELVQQLAKAEGIAIPDAEFEAELISAMNQILRTGTYKTWDEYLSVTGTDPLTFESQVRASLLAQKLLTAHGGPAEVEQVHAAHILVGTEETGNEVLAKLKAGGSFADLAKEYSTDSNSKDNGGDLGWFPQGMMVSEFDAAAFALQPGETSGLVETSYGYHIIRVLERGVRSVRAELLPYYNQLNFQRWFEAELAKANVETLVTFAEPSP